MTDDSHPEPDCLIFCCSGASNVGVLSFQAAIRLAQEGFGEFSCIAGIGSGNPPMIRKAKSDWGTSGDRWLPGRLWKKDHGHKQGPG